MFEAKIISDSICSGHRLTTMQVTHPRIIHSEFNTHCAFARNASSSRAIPFKKTVQKVLEDPFIPTKFGVNQSGMQAFSHLTGMRLDHAIAKWLEARDKAVQIAEEMAAEKCLVCKGTGIKLTATWIGQGDVGEPIKSSCPHCGGDGLGLNVHKQIVNRLIEPWSWITVCVTGDEGAWSNYNSLRCHPDAADDIQRQAYMAQRAYYTSTPKILLPGDWHTPYVTDLERAEIKDSEALLKISVGRCARTSYLTQEGTRDFAKDIELHDRLRYHVPLHASPFEHVCQAMGNDMKYAKYTGWQSLRNSIPNEYSINFQPNYAEYFAAHPDF